MFSTRRPPWLRPKASSYLLVGWLAAISMISGFIAAEQSSASRAGSRIELVSVEDAVTRPSGDFLSQVQTLNRFELVKTSGEPRARFSVSCDGLSCAMDASASQDSQRDVRTFAWESDDGGRGEGMIWFHQFRKPGVHTVYLTVTDARGLEDVLSRELFITNSNAFTVPPNEIGGTGLPVPTPPAETIAPPSQASSPPPPSTGGVGQGQLAQQILDQCFEGTLAFRPPSPMKLGETQTWTIRVALRGSPVDPSHALPGEGPIETRHPRLCELMRAELTGDGMDISLASGSSGLIALPAKDVGMWSWNITPREAGNKQIVLTLWTEGPQDADVLVVAYQEVIQVEVGFGYVLGSFVRDWAAPLGLTVPVLLGAASGLYLWWRKRQYRPRHASNSTP